MKLQVALAVCLMGAACGRTPPVPAPDVAAPAQAEPLNRCPTEPVRTSTSPGTEPRHESAEHWIERLDDPDAVVVPAAELAGLNALGSAVRGGWRDIDRPEVGDRAAIDASIAERLRVMGADVEAGRLVPEEPGAFERATELVRRATAVDHQRLIVSETPLRCVPIVSGLFKVPKDPDFDRNACSSLHPGERVRVLARGPKGHWLYVDAGYTVGWIHDAEVSDRLSLDAIDAWAHSDRLVPLRDDVVTRAGTPVRLGVSVPLLETVDDGYRVLVAGAQGPVEDFVAADAPVSSGFPPLTRRRLFEVAFSELGDPYGWGGLAGERDCSRLVRDVLATFGVQMARHSGVQAQLGVRRVDVEGLAGGDKRVAIREAARSGVVVLYMRGHIMLYVGHDGAHDYAISAMSEYLTPCEGGPETTHRIDRVAVTTLSLGDKTRRTGFLDRIVTLVVFEPPAEDDGAATLAAP